MQVAVRGEEVQLASSEGLFEVVQESPPEHPRQHPDRKEEPRRQAIQRLSSGAMPPPGTRK